VSTLHALELTTAPTCSQHAGRALRHRSFTLRTAALAPAGRSVNPPKTQPLRRVSVSPSKRDKHGAFSRSPGELHCPSGVALRPHLSRLPLLSPLSAAGCGPGRRCRPGLPAGGRRWWSGAPGPRAAELRSRGVLPVAPSRGRGAAHEVKMVIRVFVASSSGSVAIKKRQQDVVRFLEANRIEFEEVDITMSEEKRQWMYRNIPEDRQPAQGNPLPPQIFSDDRYCGDYDGFFESKESNTVFSFLGLKPNLAPKES
uniref:SH3 domain binding glutamate rich protein like 2 n=1 Tax=Phasianus colchicus TaxID=9054 RepID=A0A669QHX0_PHACC